MGKTRKWWSSELLSLLVKKNLPIFLLLENWYSNVFTSGPLYMSLPPIQYLFSFVYLNSFNTVFSTASDIKAVPGFSFCLDIWSMKRYKHFHSILLLLLPTPITQLCHSLENKRLLQFPVQNKPLNFKPQSGAAFLHVLRRAPDGVAALSCWERMSQTGKMIPESQLGSLNTENQKSIFVLFSVSRHSNEQKVVNRWVFVWNQASFFQERAIWIFFPPAAISLSNQKTLWTALVAVIANDWKSRDDDLNPCSNTEPFPCTKSEVGL